MKSERRHGPDSESSLDELALEYIGKYGAMSVQQLHDSLRVNNPSLTESEVTAMVWRLSDEGKAGLEEVWPPTDSFTGFLGLWERHLSLYGSLVIALATILSVYALPQDLPWVAIRWVLASVFVLLVPGFVAVEALFTKEGDLGSLERFALGIGLSLAIVMFVGLMLNYTPWGIRLTPIVISLTVISFSLALVALVRRYLQR